MIIPFSEWLPDLPDYMNLGGIAATNCIPQPGGYAPFKGLSVASDAMDAIARGAISVKNLNGDAETFSGNETKLYRLTGQTFNNVTRVSPVYALGTEDYWEFAQFGTRIIAVALAENPQSYVIGTSTNFADLAGSPPKASTVAIVRDFAVLGGVTTQQNRVQWSDINDPTNWSTGQSGQQDIAEGGSVVKIIGGEVGYIFQEAAITRMTYVGPDVYFDFDQVQKNLGVAAARSVIRVGGFIYFLATDGFYRLNIGDGSVSPIGHGKVDKTVLNDLDTNSLYLMSAGYDTNLKIVVWAYPSRVNSGFANRLLIHHYTENKWSLAEVDVDMIMSHIAEGITLDGLDSLFPDLDTAGMPSLDSVIFKGGERVLAGIDTAHKLGTFESDNLALTIETGDFEGIQGRRSYFNEIRPLVDSGTISGIIRSRERLADSVSNSPTGSLNSHGYVPIDSLSGRYHRVRLTIPAGTVWNFAQGVELDPKQAGRY